MEKLKQNIQSSDDVFYLVHKDTNTKIPFFKSLLFTRCPEIIKHVQADSDSLDPFEDTISIKNESTDNEQALIDEMPLNASMRISISEKYEEEEEAIKAHSDINSKCYSLALNSFFEYVHFDCFLNGSFGDVNDTSNYLGNDVDKLVKTLITKYMPGEMERVTELFSIFLGFGKNENITLKQANNAVDYLQKKHFLKPTGTRGSHLKQLLKQPSNFYLILPEVKTCGNIENIDNNDDEDEEELVVPDSKYAEKENDPKKSFSLTPDIMCTKVVDIEEIDAYYNTFKKTSKNFNGRDLRISDVDFYKIPLSLCHFSLLNFESDITNFATYDGFHYLISFSQYSYIDTWTILYSELIGDCDWTNESSNSLYDAYNLACTGKFKFLADKLLAILWDKITLDQKISYYYALNIYRHEGYSKAFAILYHTFFVENKADIENLAYDKQCYAFGNYLMARGVLSK